MKKILFLVFGLWTIGALADTISVNWYVGDSVYSTSTCTVGGDLNLPTTPTKRGHTFLGWTAYIPLEYIEATGTQYIDTGFKPNQDTRVVMEFQVVTRSMHDDWIFGTRLGEKSGAFNMTLLKNNTSWRMDYGNTETTIDVAGIYQTKLKIDQNKNRATAYDISGNVLFDMSTQYSNFSSPCNLLFPGGVSTNCTPFKYDGLIKIYSFKLYNNETLICDMVPALDYNNVPCMYDKVESKLYYNAGTGEFVAGPEL